MKPFIFKSAWELFLCLILLCQPVVAGKIRYTYDDAGRIVGVEYNDGLGSTIFLYDQNGNLIKRENSVNKNVQALTLQVSGSGKVTSSPSGIDCGSDCLQYYTSDTQVTLSPMPDSGYQFGGWSGACSGFGECIVSMNLAKTVTAAFNSPGVQPPVSTHTLTIKKIGTGTGFISSQIGRISCGTNCSETYPHGFSVPLAVTADEGSVFSGWTTGPCQGTLGCTVKMMSDNTITANFIKLKTLTVILVGPASGRVVSSSGDIDCGTDCTETYSEEDSVTLRVIEDDQSKFAGWFAPECSGTGECTVSMTSHRIVLAEYVIRHNLKITVDTPERGRITSQPEGIDCGTDCEGRYNEDTEVLLTAIPETGFGFKGWQGSRCTGTEDCTVIMGDERSVTAVFTSKYKLEITKNGSGDGRVWSTPAGIDCGADCSQDYFKDTSVALSALPDDDSEFTGWSGSGCSGVGNCIVEIDVARTVTANFKNKNDSKQQYTITVVKEGSGSGEVISAPAGIQCGYNCNRIFDEDTEITLTTKFSDGSLFTGWNSPDCSGTDDCKFKLNNNTTVIASFRADQDFDGISDEEESKGPNNGDGNNDKIPDQEQAFVASFLDKNGAYVVIESPKFSKISDLSLHEIPWPEDGTEKTEESEESEESEDKLEIKYPANFFSFIVEYIEPGSTNDVILYLPKNEDIDSFYMYAPTKEDSEEHRFEFLYNKENDNQNGAEIFQDGDRTRIVLHLSDGQNGDKDLDDDNGDISITGGPSATVRKEEKKSGGGSGNSLCFIGIAAD